MSSKQKEKTNKKSRNVKTNINIIHLKKFWNFVWNDNSLASWAVSIVLAFVIIRFIFYPLIGLIVGTSMPIVAVISSSMEHPGEDWTQNPAYCKNNIYCLQEEWYLEKGITPNELQTFPFKNGFNKGDIMIIVGKKPSKIEIGDVIVFNAGKNYPIIHRVVAIHKTNTSEIYYETKGDNNPAQITASTINEKYILSENVKGVAKIKISYLGYIKIVAANGAIFMKNLITGA
ncbi:MAG: signal peptidase I [Candidatus Woesearchaeota archaeon]|jgi:signal peptidase I